MDYLRDIYSDESKEIIFQKSSQCGISEYLLARAFYLAEVRCATGLFCHPSQTQLNDFSHERIDEAILFSEHLRSKVNGINNVGLKSVAGTFLYFRGMQNLNQIISVAADFVFLDERDQMIQSRVPIVKKRLGNSTMKHMIEVSTPTFPEYGISGRFAESDGREWFIKCGSCGKRQNLTMSENVFPKKDDKGFYFGCSKCKRHIDQAKSGEWVPARRDRELRGYHISKLMSPMSTADELKASEKEDKTIHYNFDLGLPYAREGGKIGVDILNAIRGDHESTQTATKAILGIDVGKVLHCVYGTAVIGKDHKGQPIVGETIVLDFFTVDDFDDLDGLMRSGDVYSCVVDALPETRAVKEFAQKHGGKVWIAFYSETPARDAYLLPPKKKREIHIDRTQSLDNTFAGITDRTMSIPADSAAIPDVYPQICAPIRTIIRNKKGNSIAVYNEFGKPDHYAHALNYFNAAAWIKAKKSARRILSGGSLSG